MKKVIVIYHKDCPDGFSSAWVAWKKFGSKADYTGVNPKHLPSKLPRGSQIFALDTSFSKKNLKKLIDRGNKITVIDHHPSEERDVKSAPTFVFDLNHSGAVLAWKYFHPKKPIPLLLKYIEDNDLWRFKLPHAHIISSAIHLYNMEFKIWSKLVADLERSATRKELIKIGSIVLKNENKLIEQIISNAQVVRFAGRKILAVNSPIFQSEIGHMLAKKLPPLGIIWSQKDNGDIRISLRSIGKIDISKIAKKYGGGGHKSAAGFTIPAGKNLPWQAIS